MRRALSLGFLGLLGLVLAWPVRAAADITNLGLTLPSALLTVLDDWVFFHVGPTSRLHALDAANGTVVDLNKVGTVVGAVGNTVYFYVLEAHQNDDLNYDGDKNDFVFHTFDRATGDIDNLAVAQSGISMSIPMSASLMAFLTSESHEARNYNEDGDFNDFVVRILETGTGTARTLPYAVRPFPLPAPGDDMVALAVDEATHGNVDLNGDGDKLDQVLHVHDTRSGMTTNVGIAAFFSLAQGRSVTFSVFEGAQGGADLNGDGDARDSVVHVYDLATGLVQNTGLASGITYVVGGSVVFWVSESSQGRDLNSDLDTADYILHTLDPTTALTTNLGLAVRNAELRAQDGLAFFPVSEADHGDLNGDGDATDGVLHVFASGMVTNLGVEASAYRGSPTRIAAAVVEAAQGGADLNGDGDSGDEVLHVFDRSSGVWTNLKRHSVTFDVADDIVLFQVSEQESAADMNGDGDAVDFVYFAHDAIEGATGNLRLAGRQGQRVQPSWAPFEMRVSGGAAVFVVNERSQGADLNGDGFLDDAVLHLARPPFAATIATLRADLAELGESGSIDQGAERALSAILAAAARQVEGGHAGAAAAQLRAFANLVRALVRSGGVPEAEGQQLIDDAVEVAEGLG